MTHSLKLFRLFVSLLPSYMADRDRKQQPQQNIIKAIQKQIRRKKNHFTKALIIPRIV